MMSTTPAGLAPENEARRIRAARAHLVFRRMAGIGLCVTVFGALVVASLTTAILVAAIPMPPIAVWGAYGLLASGLVCWSLGARARRLIADWMRDLP
jgi:hypothetical protein